MDIRTFEAFSMKDAVKSVKKALGVDAVIITAAYYLWAMQRVFLGKLNQVYVGFPDVNWRERITLYPLAVFMIFLGFYPQFILHAINPALQMLIQNLRPV